MAVATPEVFRFAIALSASVGMTNDLENALLAAGCDDALLWRRGGVVGLTFAREAAGLGDAVWDVERAGLSVVRVEVGL